MGVPENDIHEQPTVGGPPAAVHEVVRAPASASTRDASPRLEPSILPGDVLGRYEIEERLGSGGMGVVYRAHDPQLRRAVALKLMRPVEGEDSLGHATERALREARALAQLSHPNVVEIFDVGMFGGQLFLAMELLDGLTLSKWLLRHEPTWSRIVATLVQAGRGLAAAHARGVVHRDFKPDNVVITHDGSVRVVDFGLATQQPTSAREGPRHWFAQTESRTDLSTTGVVAGTPPYMSPEQLRGELVDARSDQFSFCVALFRALHRRRPYQGTTIAELLDDMQCRGRPIAVRRRGSAVVHRAMLRGLSIDPERRWPSMDALLEALEPRTSRRSWVGLGVGLLGVGAVGAGALATAVRPAGVSCEPPARATETWSDEALEQIHLALSGTGLRYAQDAWERFAPRYRALGVRWVGAYTEVCEGRRSPEHDALAADRAVACLYQSLERAQTLAEVLREADPVALGRVDETLAAMEDPNACLTGAAAEDLDALDPKDHAGGQELRRRLARADVLGGLGRYADALALVDDIRDHATDAQWRLRLRGEIATGFLLDQLGKYEDAVERLTAAALEARTRRADALAARAAVKLMRSLGPQLQRTDEALQWLRFAQASLEGLDGHDEIRESLWFTHAGVLLARGEHAAALESYERAQGLCTSSNGDDAFGCVYITLAVSVVLDIMGRHEEARTQYERALARYEEHLGPWHPKLATPTDNLGIVLYRLGDYEGAAEHHARSLAIREAALGPDNPEVGLSLTNLGLAELELERLADARVHQERAVELWRASLGEEHPHVAAAITNLALVRSLEGASDDEVIALHRQALQIREASLGPEHPEVGTSLANLGNTLGTKGDAVESRRHLDRARTLWVKAYGEDHARVASLDLDLGDLARSQAAWDEAADHYDRARRGYEAALGPDHERTAWATFLLGDAELERGQLERAKPLIEHAHRTLAAMPHEVYHGAAATFGLARLRVAEGQLHQARALGREAKEQTQALEATDARGPTLRERVDVWLEGLTAHRPRSR